MADVVVCHHVLYNVPDIEPFLRGLHDHARRRVVIEITAEHPRAWMNRYWERFWGIERPSRPVAEDALAITRELGFGATEERATIEPTMHDASEIVPMIRRHLCLPPEREPEVAQAFEELPRPRIRGVVTISWDVG